MALRKSWIIVGAVVLPIAALVVLWAVYEGPLRDPEAALQDFVSASFRAEEQLTDPLILAGPRVRPRVLEAIKDQNFKLRRYAIGYFGCARYVPALPTLEQILADPAEKNYFRADALEAIWLTDLARGRSLAPAHSGAPELLGRIAGGLLSGSYKPDCRTWFQALVGYKE